MGRRFCSWDFSRRCRARPCRQRHHRLWRGGGLLHDHRQPPLVDRQYLDRRPVPCLWRGLPILCSRPSRETECRLRWKELLASFPVPRSATSTTLRMLNRCRSAATIFFMAALSAVLPGRISQAIGQPSRSTATQSTINRLPNLVRSKANRCRNRLAGGIIKSKRQTVRGASLGTAHSLGSRG